MSQRLAEELGPSIYNCIETHIRCQEGRTRAGGHLGWRPCTTGSGSWPPSFGAIDGAAHAEPLPLRWPAPPRPTSYSWSPSAQKQHDRCPGACVWVDREIEGGRATKIGGSTLLSFSFSQAKSTYPLPAMSSSILLVQSQNSSCCERERQRSGMSMGVWWFLVTKNDPKSKEGAGHF